MENISSRIAGVFPVTVKNVSTVRHYIPCLLTFLNRRPPYHFYPFLDLNCSLSKLAGRNRSRSWRFRHPLPTRCQSERTFKGGGWRVNSSPSLLLTDAGTVRGKVPLFPGRYFGIEALDPEAISNAGGTHKSQKWKQHSCSRNRFVPMADDEAK